MLDVLDVSASARLFPPSSFMGVVPLAQPVPASVAEWIKVKRKESNLTLEEIGQYLGATKTTIQRYESAKRPVMFDTMMQIADALRVPRSEATAVWVKANGGELPRHGSQDASLIAEAYEKLPATIKSDVKGLILSIAGMRLAQGGLGHNYFDGAAYGANGEPVELSDETKLRIREMETEFTLESTGEAEEVSAETSLTNTDKNQ